MCARTLQNLSTGIVFLSDGEGGLFLSARRRALLNMATVHATIEPSAKVLPPGVPATLLLLGTTCVGAVLGKYWIAARHYKRPLGKQNGKMLHLAIVIFTVSLTFWTWAVTKVVTSTRGDRDWGAMQSCMWRG